jgi:DUF1680 family protein
MLNALPIGSVALAGELGRRIDSTIRNNMLAVDIDRDFLAPYRTQEAESAYIGLGHFLDALARFAAYRKDPEVEALRERILSVLLATRDASGYTGLFPAPRRLSHLWDVHETSHLIYGLATDHRYRPEGPSLGLARGLAGWLVGAWRADPGKAAQQFVMATLDLEPALLNLYAETADQTLLDFCIRDRELPEWNRPIVEGRWGRIEGHVYDYLSRCIAQLTLMRWQPSVGLTRATRRALDYMLHGHGMMVTGELGDHECWHSSQEGTINLGETCATAYLVRLLHVLLCHTGEPLYGDLMERAITNALFASQSPDGRRIRYYTPIDGQRQYFGPDTYCCPNNFRRIVSELPAMVCYSSPRGVVLNLYSPATIRTAAPDGTPVELRVSTAYPSEGTVSVEVLLERPSAFDLELRIPRWCASASVAVEGEASERAADPGTMHRISRTWRPGDRVELRLPMATRFVAGRKAQCGRVAVLRGPQVFCLSRARSGELQGIDLRLIVLDPNSLSEPRREDSLRLDGRSIPVRAWGPGAWYPVAAPNLSLNLTEFADPGGELVYLKTPVPEDRRYARDELMGPTGEGRPGVADDFYGDLLSKDLTDDESAGTLRRLQS